MTVLNALRTQRARRDSGAPLGTGGALLQIDDLTRRYGGGDTGVTGVTLNVDSGEILSVLGPSGSGKSTVLKCVAGLERPDGGRIRLGSMVFSDAQTHAWVPPNRRGISVVFQSLALWPHMTVLDNVAYPLIARKAPRDSIRREAERYLDLVGCLRYAGRRPVEISGGEQQRVALARALVGQPEIVLFDEPFSSLDASLRASMRRWLLELREQTSITALFVTHDQLEAFTLGDRVAVMLDGTLHDVGTPADLFQHPRTERTGRVLGALNTFPASVDGGSAGGLSLGADFGALRLDPGRSAGAPSAHVTVGIRPGNVEITPTSAVPASASNTYPGTVTFSSFAGTSHHYEVRLGSVTLEAVSPVHAFTVGEGVTVHLPAEHLMVFRDGAEGSDK